jgi:hypothetical protein
MQQAADARAAIGHTVRELANLDRLAHEHPWLVVVTAATAGFILGTVTGRERGRRPEPDGIRWRRSGALSTAFGTAYGVIIPALQAALQGLIVGKFAAREPTQNGTTQKVPQENPERG